jgi:cytidylate kinase
MIITIDGPTASGKSSTAYAVAHALDFYHINSGFLYRACAYIACTYRGYTLETIETITLADVAWATDEKRFVYTIVNNNTVISFDAHAITGYLKTPIMDQAASKISKVSCVRDRVNCLQRTIARTHNIVADGRDCGSVVFPHAELKIFLTASLEVRAARWLNEQRNRGNDISLEEAIASIELRDMRDTQRAVDPLIVPHEAYVIDTSQSTKQEVVDHIVTLAHALINGGVSLSRDTSLEVR